MNTPLKNALFAAESVAHMRGYEREILPLADLARGQARRIEELEATLAESITDENAIGMKDAGPYAKRRMDAINSAAREVLARTVEPLAPEEEPDPSDAPMVALRFIPQVWVNDYGIEVDSPGDDTWRVPAAEFMRDFPDQETWECEHELRDSLRCHKNAPQWLKYWSGPFEVETISDPWNGEPLTTEES